MSRAAIAIFAAFALASSAPAEEMLRVVNCQGDGVAMEIYVAVSAVTGNGLSEPRLAEPVQGAFVFDYSKIGKGKSLEAIRASAAADKSALVVERHERGAPTVKIPGGGGTVDFDRRWGLGAKCGRFGADLGQ